MHFVQDASTSTVELAEIEYFMTARPRCNDLQLDLAVTILDQTKRLRRGPGNVYNPALRAGPQSFIIISTDFPVFS